MQRTFAWLMGIAVFAWLAVPMCGQPTPEEAAKMSVWMKAKTEFSQNIMTGLIHGDFDKVTSNAQALGVAGYFEGVFRGSHPDYKEHVKQFLAADRELVRQAEAKSLYGATLAYSQMSLSCVQCHKLVRDGKK